MDKRLDDGQDVVGRMASPQRFPLEIKIKVTQPKTKMQMNYFCVLCPCAYVVMLILLKILSFMFSIFQKSSIYYKWSFSLSGYIDEEYAVKLTTDRRIQM